ncbi:acetolactate synthase-1/2/3 large subunit [Dethiosulfatibacter aminovorans DSM 17477]|uniref:Acetolactate synthase-1/2/3 large subunit n=1 Tax=Dethiosulfatibacter aminovorans DSM 17477 TaxID=1121476 RepID=A0A1M6IX46_9FIRM|nr:thiamine pyrophosphate-binding protein [Dethiosulfatibacter aminovorans]SHJ38969.1 acetolactate synthase-1/2/3 large subunit [Dethiosulfatibacter aminovorans DSM 17477]
MKPIETAAEFKAKKVAKSGKMRGADALVELLKSHNVEYIFGVPGDTSMAFHDAMRINKEEITHILCRDERNAAYSADAYARMSGKTGVVEVPSGGGALYVVPGVSEANVSNIPLMCIASEISMSSDETCALTDCNQEALFNAVTKWNTKVKLGSKIPHIMKKAFRMSTGGVSGAVGLTFPENILREEVDFSEDELNGPDYIGGFAPFKNSVFKSDIAKLMEMLGKSNRPIVLAGGGVHLSGAHDELEKFVENFRLPVVTSIDGKGAVSEMKPMALGVVGANGGSEEANDVLKNADLVIVLGSKLNNVTTMGKRLINQDAKVVQVDLGEEVIGNNIKIDLPIMCDIRSLLSEVNSMFIDGNGKGLEEWNGYAEAKLKEKRDRIDEEYKLESERILPAQIFKVLEENTDENAVFVADAGTPTPYLSSYLRLKSAGKNTVIPRGHGALGYALAASIGAQVARPDSKVISMFGDASFGMAMGDLETAKRYNLPIVFVNFQNNTYGWIKTIQTLYYEEKYFGVDFGAIDAVKIAEGFGMKGKSISRNDEIEETFKWALELNEPVMINVVIEPPTDNIPPVYQWEHDYKLEPKDRKKLVY